MQVAEVKKKRERGRPRIEEKFTHLEHQLALLPEKFASGSQSLKEVEELSVLEAALKELTTRQFILIDLLYFQRKTGQEVMSLMGWTEDNLYQHKYRALRRIRILLDDNRPELYEVKERQKVEQKRDYWVLTTIAGKWEIVNKSYKNYFCQENRNRY